MDINKDNCNYGFTIKRTTEINESETLNWHMWCRLCAKNGDDNFPITDAQCLDASQDLVMAIEKHFSINIILEEQQYSIMLCTECFSFMLQLLSYEKKILEAQQIFATIIETRKLDNNMVVTDLDMCDDAKSAVNLPEQIYTDESPISISNTECNPLEIGEELNKATQKIGEIDTFNTGTPENPLCGSEATNDSDSEETATNTDIESRHKKLECQYCSRKFYSKYYHQSHLKYAHNKNIDLVEHKCTHCSRVFNRKMNLDKHLKTHFVEKQQKVVQCPHCNAKLVENRLNFHIKFMHLNGPRFLCDECGGAYRTMQNLNEHKLTHTDYAPYACEFCSRRFKAEKWLKKHMDLHDTSKRICKICNAELKSNLTLKRHMVIHSNEKPFKCDYCGFSCKRAKSLKTHLLSHAGLKPYACEICFRSFTSGANCRTHKLRAHPEQFTSQEALSVPQTLRDVPNLAALRALAKNSKNLKPIVPRRTKAKQNDKSLE